MSWMLVLIASGFTTRFQCYMWSTPHNRATLASLKVWHYEGWYKLSNNSFSPPEMNISVPINTNITLHGALRTGRLAPNSCYKYNLDLIFIICLLTIWNAELVVGIWDLQHRMWEIECLYECLSSCYIIEDTLIVYAVDSLPVLSRLSHKNEAVLKKADMSP